MWISEVLKRSKSKHFSSDFERSVVVQCLELGQKLNVQNLNMFGFQTLTVSIHCVFIHTTLFNSSTDKICLYNRVFKKQAHNDDP